MLFHVIDKDGNVDDSRDWAITQDGELISVVNGWGCEGGGGSDAAPDGHRAVFGNAPPAKPAPTIVAKTAAPKPFMCAMCFKKFATETALEMHRQSVGHHH